MGVRQRENGRWQADVIVAGRRVRKDFHDRSRAEAWEAATRAAMEAKRPPKPAAGDDIPGAVNYSDSPGGGRKGSDMRTLRDAVDRAFDRYYRGTKWEIKTWQTMRRVMGDIGPDTPLSRINSDTLDSYVSRLRSQNKSGSTINSRLAVLSKVLRFAHDRGAVDKMPRIERESVHNLRLRWLSPDEEAKVLKLLRGYGKEDVAETVEALIDTGMRQSELFALSPADVDLEAGTLTIWQTRHGSSKTVYKRTKNGEMRTIYMTQRVRKILERRVQSASPEGLLFPGDIYWLRHAWDRARAAMGLMGDPNFVPYICRHTCASRLVQRGVPIPVIQKWMGHKTIQITMRYANVAPENLRAAADTLDGGWK